jgi:predicted alpha/beta superfamily hydrolase
MLWQREIHHHADGARVLHVALPEGYGSRAEPYPVLVCLDAQWTFGTVCDAALNLGLARLLPRVMVVGVGWSARTAREVVHARARDFTPTDGALPAAVIRNMAGAPVFGGAQAFQGWLLDDALPELEASYNIDRAQRTLIGHSLSGLFSLYTLLTQPAAFSRWLIASPSSWWDKRVVFDLEQHNLAHGPALAGRVFMSAGEFEQCIGGEIPMLANTEEFHARLAMRHSPSFETVFRVLPGEIHHSTMPAAVSHGLRWLFR